MAPVKLVPKKPASGTPKDWSFPSIAKTKLDSGLQILAANISGRHVGTAVLVIDAGAAYEPDAQGGVGFLAARALTEGTEKHKGSAFIQAFEALGADIQANCTWDTFTVTLHAPMDRMEPALELMAQCVMHPGFPGADVDRFKQERLGGILQQYVNAASRATLAFDKAVYSSSTPYSRPAQGSYWSVYQLGKRQVRKYYEQFATPGAATLVIAGDIDEYPLVKAAEKLFADWRGKESPRPKPLIQEGIRNTYVLLVDREDSEQSQIEIGHMGVARISPDYFPLHLADPVIGGLFGSRLNLKLREEKGYTYGARAGFNFRRNAGPFKAAAAVDTPVTTEAIADTIEVMEKVKTKGITKQELEEVKGFRTGRFPLQVESPEGLAGALVNLATFGLPEDYYDTYLENIQKVTLDDVNEAVSKHLRPERSAIVVVGDAEKLADPLRSAEFGPVAIVEDPEPGDPPIE